MSSPKPHRIRVRVLDGKRRDGNKLKGQLVPHVDVLDARDGIEFVICAVKDTHLEQVRAKLGATGLVEIEGGDTSVPAPAAEKRPRAQRRRQDGRQEGAGPHHRGPKQMSDGSTGSNGPDLRKKPYGFVALPKELTTAAPVWHDGTNSDGRLSGEIRCELETLTPMLVGWERGTIGGQNESWPVTLIGGVGRLANGKSVLCPLRAPWGNRPVIIPGDSLKGLLRHELGALLGAPMERVAERSYSYRPNSLYPNEAGPRLIPRLARVPEDGVETQLLDSHSIRVPTRLELLPADLKYDRKRQDESNYYRFDDSKGEPYRGGQGAGEKLNSKRNLHRTLTANPSVPTQSAAVPAAVQDSYLATLRHLIDLDHGHFSKRHPDVPVTVTGDAARKRILHVAANVVFQPGDLIWVEWDTVEECIVSFGWHYYYRWAYRDSVRRRAGSPERQGLFPLSDERAYDGDGAPKGLSAVRRLLGYTGDNEGSKDIGEGDYGQLMGRLSVNSGIEVVAESDTIERRFLPPTSLKELGMPRPSAVEHYIQQPHHPESRPSDRAALVTYGDAAGYDSPGDLAGRKFYLDRKDAYTGEPWKDESESNRLNDRSTLALEASCPGRRFRFAVRFRDLDAFELSAILVALCPQQFHEVLGGTHADGYCSKLGYARPLGWGTVRIDTKMLLLLDVTHAEPALNPVPNILEWVREHYHPTTEQTAWLEVHRHKHPNAADYPRAKDRNGNENIHTFHTRLRAEHTRLRRYVREDE